MGDVQPLAQLPFEEFAVGVAWQRLTGFELYGCDGISLSEHWSSGVRSLHGMTTDKFPNCCFIGGNAHSANAVNAVHLLDEQATHVAYILGEAHKHGWTRLEPEPRAVEDYTEVIRTSPESQALLKMYLECTPGYYNAEGNATKQEDLFVGGRYGPGPLAFYRLLEEWRNTGTQPGMKHES